MVFGWKFQLIPHSLTIVCNIKYDAATLTCLIADSICTDKVLKSLWFIWKWSLWFIWKFIEKFVTSLNPKSWALILNLFNGLFQWSWSWMYRVDTIDRIKCMRLFFECQTFPSSSCTEPTQWAIFSKSGPSFSKFSLENPDEVFVRTNDFVHIKNKRVLNDLLDDSWAGSYKNSENLIFSQAWVKICYLKKWWAKNLGAKKDRRTESNNTGIILLLFKKIAWRKSNFALG